MDALISHAWKSRAILLTALLGACASTPQATREDDFAAKRFDANPAAATLYVYRETGDPAHDGESVLYVDQRLIGTTLPRSYFRVYVRAGAHQLRGYGPDHGKIELATRNGEVYFISLNVVGGFSNFRVEDPARAKSRIKECCVLLENWAPGQRPLLR